MSAPRHRISLLVTHSPLAPSSAVATTCHLGPAAIPARPARPSILPELQPSPKLHHPSCSAGQLRLALCYTQRSRSAPHAAPWHDGASPRPSHTRAGCRAATC
eukprot:scaffold90933_cov55-Phaeocystis_antarctica.AAC.1